jgi:hypothetical protein
MRIRSVDVVYPTVVIVVVRVKRLSQNKKSVFFSYVRVTHPYQLFDKVCDPSLYAFSRPILRTSWFQICTFEQFSVFLKIIVYFFK